MAVNSKERVKKAISLQVPDMVPYGEYCIDYDTVQKILGHETYVRAKAKCTMAFWEGRREEVVQSFKEDMVELYKKLDCVDVVNLAAPLTGIGLPPRGYEPDPPKKIGDGEWQDKKGCVYKYSEITGDIVLVYDPDKWTSEYSPEDYNGDVDYIRPDDSLFEALDYIIEKLGGERYILGPSGDEVGMVLLGGMERGLTELLTNPDTVKAAARQLIAKARRDDYYCIRDGVDGVLWGQDFSYKSGPMISPEMFRELVLPVIKERVGHIRENFGLPVVKHSCGNNWKVMDMFLEAGYACYQSIQQSAGMDIKEVKEKYGDRICLWGGVAVENLVSGTMEDVRRDVRRAIEAAAPRGGFILGSTHSIAVGCRYDNYMAMLDELSKLRHCY